jgi:hypothetical protein
MKFYPLVLAVLAVWRITHLLVFEDGPWNTLLVLRRATDKPFWSGLLNCFYCCSLWVAAPFAWLDGASWAERLVLVFALSGGAILAERATTKGESDPGHFYWEEPEAEHGMLRKSETPQPNSDTGAVP